MTSAARTVLASVSALAAVAAMATLSQAAPRAVAPCKPTPKIVCGPINWTNANRTGANLSHKTFLPVGTSLRFVQTNLTNAKFAGTVFNSRPDFSRANLTHADFRGARFGRTGFDYANLTSANFVGATFTGVVDSKNGNFTDANLAGVTIPSGSQLSLAANFTRANLSHADLSGVNLVGANFTNANLTGANFTSANFLAANFTGANLTGVDFGTDPLALAKSGATIENTTCPDGHKTDTHC
jgi:uncharacterized protein YjbI with pentapeptide repeats